MLKKMGFFVGIDSIFQSKNEMVPAKPNYDKDLLEKYLESTPVIIGSPGVAFDYFNTSNKKPISGKNVKTDGHWIWPEELIYYVRNYNIALPSEFIEHCKKRNWKVDKNIDFEKLVMDLERMLIEMQ